MKLTRPRPTDDFLWIGALCGAIILLLLLNPGGYVGGGQDDWRYLHAVRCWREYGPCLPHDHWQSRWPLIAPTAALTSLFGESRLTVSLGPLAASVAALFLLAMLGNKSFGRPVGWLAAIIFAAIPAFSFQFTDLNVEGTELLFILAGYLALLQSEKDDRALWPILAGLSFSLAFQTRETSIVAVVFAALYVAITRRAPGRWLAYASIGFGLPLLAEFATFAISTGNPFWRRQLAVDHTLIPSSELLGPVDPKHSPFFNLAYIAHWRRISGIHVHWLVDWLLNLIVSGTAGASLALAPSVIFLGRKQFDRDTIRSGLILWAIGVAYGAVLALAFALDPKPRIMLVPLAMTSLALALVTWRAKQTGQTSLAYVSWAAVFLLWLPLHVGHRRTDIMERTAADWIAARPDEIEIDENTRRHLALVPQARVLPGLETERKYWLYMSSRGCKELIGTGLLPDGSISVIESDPVYLIYLRKLDTRTSLCLLRFNTPVSRQQIVRAMRQSRSDGAFITGYGGT